MEKILETQSLSKIYTSGNLAVTAVDQVSIDVKAGEFIALVGPSGSGKTTMLALLAGLLTSTNGKIFIDGHNLEEMNEIQRTQFRKEKIGFTFQTNNLVPYLTMLENVELMLRLNNNYNREGRALAIALLDRLGMADRLSSYPAQLSVGQQQRVAIARSLIHNPSVVLADEPTAALDSERAYQVVDIFSKLIHEQKKAGIMVTHDLRMCLFVDKVIEMLDGKIVGLVEERAEIDALANNSRYKSMNSNDATEPGGQLPYQAPIRSALVVPLVGDLSA